MISPHLAVLLDAGLQPSSTLLHLGVDEPRGELLESYLTHGTYTQASTFPDSFDGGELQYVLWKVPSKAGQPAASVLNRLYQAMGHFGWLVLDRENEYYDDLMTLLPESGFLISHEYNHWNDYPRRFLLARKSEGAQEMTGVEPSMYGASFARRVGKDDANWRTALRLGRYVNDHYSMSEEQQELLFQVASGLPTGATAVELGVAYGKTSAILAYGCLISGSRYVGIDDFSLVGTPDAFCDRLSHLGLPHWLIVGHTQSIPWSAPIDLLVIDAGHDHYSVAADIQQWVPLVRAGGYVAFHDYPLDVAHGGAHWAVKAYGDAATEGWEDVDYRGGLMVRRRK